MFSSFMHASRLTSTASKWIGIRPMLAATTAILMSGCGGSSEPLNPGKITAFVSVPPQAKLVRAIGGEHVVVEVLAGPGKDPHDFSPSSKQTMSLGRAEVWFTTRMPFEKRMTKKVQSNAKRLLIVDTTEGQPLHPASQNQAGHTESAEDSHADHDHGHDHEHHHHDHSAGDPHLWLSPPLLKLQAQKIANTLTAIAPEQSTVFEENLKSIQTEIEGVHSDLEKSLAPHRGATFLAYHGAFGWFAEAYGLNQEIIEYGGRSPETKRLRSTIEKAKAKGIKVVFTQPQFDRRSAEAVAEGLDGKVIEIDPLAEDLFVNLRKIGEQLVADLSTHSPGDSQ